jgi:hypothetical protein
LGSEKEKCHYYEYNTTHAFNGYMVSRELLTKCGCRKSKRGEDEGEACRKL